MIHHARVTLANAGRFHDHQVVAGRLARRHRVVQAVRDRRCTAGGHRAEEHDVGIDGVHADPISEQSTAPTPPGGIDGQHRHADLVLAVTTQSAHDLVGQARLPGPARAGDPQNGHLAGGQVPRRPVLDQSDGAGQVPAGSGLQGREVRRIGQCHVTVGNELVDHAG